MCLANSHQQGKREADFICENNGVVLDDERVKKMMAELAWNIKAIGLSGYTLKCLFPGEIVSVISAAMEAHRGRESWKVSHPLLVVPVKRGDTTVAQLGSDNWTPADVAFARSVYFMGMHGMPANMTALISHIKDVISGPPIGLSIKQSGIVKPPPQQT